MKFNTYQTFWDKISKKMKKQQGWYEPNQYYLEVTDYKDKNRFRTLICILEKIWYSCKRPYYNVYPAIVPMLLDVSLDIPMKFLSLPNETVCLCFNDDSEIQTILANKSEKFLFFTGYIKGDKSCHFKYPIKDQNETVAEALANCENASAKEGTSMYYAAFCLRLVVGISMLANSPGFIKPMPLGKDLIAFKNANEDKKQKLLKKAIKRRKQVAYTVGMDLERDISHGEKSPHFRRPHLAMFWTGKGRTKPILKLRAGAVIKPKKVTDVPTGYLDKPTKLNPSE